MTSTTVIGRWTTHPRLAAGLIGSSCVAFGLVFGVVLGADLAARSVASQTPATQDGAPKLYVARPGTIPVEQALPSSAPGNPYVNIHVPFRAPVEQAAAPSSVTVQRALPSSAPGNPYVNIHVPFREPADLTPR
jgi:hypothetical protein